MKYAIKIKQLAIAMFFAMSVFMLPTAYATSIQVPIAVCIYNESDGYEAIMLCPLNSNCQRGSCNKPTDVGYINPPFIMGGQRFEVCAPNLGTNCAQHPENCTWVSISKPLTISDGASTGYYSYFTRQGVYTSLKHYNNCKNAVLGK